MLAFIYSRCDVLRDFINSINADADVDVDVGTKILNIWANNTRELRSEQNALFSSDVFLFSF